MLEGQDAHKLGTPVSTMFPPGFFIRDVDIAAPSGYIDGLKWYDFQFTADKINLYLKLTSLKEIPKVTTIENASFKGKLPYAGLASQLKKLNPDWEITMGRLGDSGDTIFLYGKQSKSDVSVMVQGKFSVDKDGVLKFNPVDRKYYDANGQINIDAWSKALKGIIIEWKFTFMGIFLPLNRAAVSESGIYIEAGDLIPDANPNETKSQ